MTATNTSFAQHRPVMLAPEMGRAGDFVRLEVSDIVVDVLTGIYSEETHMPQPLRISVKADLAAPRRFDPDAPLSESKNYMDLRRAIEQSGAKNLVVEVTEHEQVCDFGALAAELAEIRKFARIAIDDVGAGYAGLRHVVDLQPDILKMDMILTRNVQDDPARRAITSAMVHFARDIGCKLVAEGIETEAERDTMAQLGVDYGQGYLFARPLPVVAAQQHLLGFAARH